MSSEYTEAVLRNMGLIVDDDEEVPSDEVNRTYDRLIEELYKENAEGMEVH
jgi:hypothetical protein